MPTIKTVKKNQKEVEIKIQNIIKKFEEINEVKITSVFVEHDEYDPNTTKVEVDIELGD